jgi:hypothetical protein
MLYALGSKFAAQSVYGILCLTIALPFTLKNASAASAESVIFRFPANHADGYFPDGQLTQDSSGVLYGTTALGGVGTGYNGMIFKFVPPTGAQTTGQLTVLYRFTGASGADPRGSLALGENGALYGTTPLGGDGSNDGTIFELLPPAAGKTTWTQVLIRAFAHGIDGNSPAPGVLVAKNGRLYGALAGGNSTGYGAIFAFIPPASGMTAWTEKIIYNFTGGTDGFAPGGPLISDRTGALYGTTADSGTLPFGARDGTIFKLTPPAAGKTSWTKTTLYTFKGAADGSIPLGTLLRDSSGALYGATKAGNGTVFKLTPPAKGKTAWALTTLYSFKGGADGQTPSSGLIMDKTGALIGTTFEGGTAQSRGTVFKLTPPKTATGKWTETVLHAFTGGNDGISPGGVLVSPTGLLFGVASYGGNTGCAGAPNPGGCGTIFKLTE